MRVVTNEALIKRNRLISQILFVASLIILFGGLIFTNTTPGQMDISYFIPCLIMPIGLLTTLFSVRLTNQYIRLPHPEDVIREGVKGAVKGSTLYNYILPTRHVIVSPMGVFSLTTRFQETKFKVEGDKWFNWKARGPLAPVLLFLKQESLGDPFKDAKKDAAAVQTIVDKVLPDANVEVQPIVVFISDKADVEIIDPVIPVVYAAPKRKPTLKSALRAEKRTDAPSAAVLTNEQIRALDQHILSLVGANDADTDNTA
jgi:hypothetical protein